MKALQRAVLILLAISLLMSGCAGNQAAEETAAPTQVTQVPTAAPTEEPTEAPTEPTEPDGWKLADTVLPETNAATGTLKFYIQDQEIYAGGPVSSLLNADITTYEDFDEILQPWHVSSVKRVRVELEDTKEKNKPFVFFMAMNASDEPKAIRDCLFYSITINTDKNVMFGSGREETPFVTGKTTRKELVEAYGEPDYDVSRHDDYREIAYYEPFSCAYFSFKDGKVRQVHTYYSANVFGDLAKDFAYEFTDSYAGNDGYILMNQYMDVMPYLQVRDAGEKLEKGTGVLEKLTESITMGGVEVVLGVCCTEMPELFGEPFWDLILMIHNQRIVRAGRTNPEEFYFMNPAKSGKEYREKPKDAYLCGVITRNLNYENWGKEYGNYHEFQYENITQDSTIEDVLEQYGMPKKLHCTSYARGCFAWLFYEDKAGNELKIGVDPILNQVMELQILKYYEDISMYP